MTDTETIRHAVQMQQFPNGIPSLWCPTLTHFRVAREPDAQRIRSHLASLSPVVHGILMPGSTGEGWEMTLAKPVRVAA
jgi:dihydrodipicolinate synthase/N-acetylneuraminate lyase